MMNKQHLFIAIIFSLCFSKLTAQGMIDVAEIQGLFGLENDFYSSGVSFVDFDMDGDDDITLGSGSNFPILFFENEAGSFQQRSFVNDVDQIHQVTWVDYDNDGDLDFSYNGYGGMKLHENLGGMIFQDVTSSLNLDAIDCEGYPICWADFDKDGDLDFFLTQFCFPEDGALQYYKNNGDKTFTFSNSEAGINQDWAIFTIAGSVIDYNNDGWEDFYMTIDFLEGNVLLKNNGNGTFSNVSSESGADLAMDGMSSTVGDIDLDGDMDIYITNSYYDFRPDEHNKLLLNDGDEGFDEVAESWGVFGDDWSWGAQFFDVDADLDLDLMVNEILGDGIPSNLYLNDYPNPTFLKDESNINYNTQGYVYGYGSAQGDFNQDGYVDIFSNTNDNDVVLLRNNWNDNNWLKVNLTGIESNFMGIGTRLEAYVDGKVLLRHVRCGEGYVSQNSYTQFFGLSNFISLDSLIVAWPLGQVDTYYDVPANSLINCIEGEELKIDLGFNGFWKNAICENAEAELILSFQGGEPPYNYEIQSAGGQIIESGEIEESIDKAVHTLPLDDYNIMMVDAAMNEINTVIYKSFAFPSPIIATNATDSSSEINGDGAIGISASHGMSPYSYELYDQNGNLIDDSNVVTGLSPGEYTAVVIDANGCLDSEQISVGLLSNLYNYIQSQVSIFPNPSPGSLNIKLNENFHGDIYLEDAQGKYLRAIDSKASLQSIDLTELTNGVYYLVFKSKGKEGLVSKKVVVMR